MRFVAVTACPTGVAHTLMAAEALRRQAQVMGHEIEVETQGAEGTKQPLNAEAIAHADGVIIAADIYVDPLGYLGPVDHVALLCRLTVGCLDPESTSRSGRSRSMVASLPVTLPRP